MENKGFSTDEVCRIIETCASSRVASLKWGDLQVTFGQKAEPSPYSPAPLAGRGPELQASPSPVAEMTALQHIEQTRRSVEEQELLAREDEIANLLITDPYKAEQLIRDGELIEAESGSGDDDDDEET